MAPVGDLVAKTCGLLAGHAEVLPAGTVRVVSPRALRDRLHRIGCARVLCGCIRCGRIGGLARIGGRGARRRGALVATRGLPSDPAAIFTTLVTGLTYGLAASGIFDLAQRFLPQPPTATDGQG